MSTSPEIKELLRDVEILRTVITELVAEIDGRTENAFSERLLNMFPDGAEVKERLISLLELSRLSLPKGSV